jgi:hypothetical protein
MLARLSAAPVPAEEPVAGLEALEGAPRKQKWIAHRTTETCRHAQVFVQDKSPAESTGQ